MGVISVLLLTTGHLGGKFHVPIWVILASHVAIAGGTMAGGWRIVRTMGSRLTALEPYSGFSAESAAAASIIYAAQVGVPVSTTHTITGSVMGAGAGRQFSALRLNVVADIVGSWILTIPATATIAWVMFAILHTAGLNG